MIGYLHWASIKLKGEVILEKIDEEGALSLADVLHLFRQICSALDFIHSRGLIHRDLKPSNIMLTQGEDEQMLVKLLDFGIAKNQSESDQALINLTRAGMTMGTPYYMSPEQITGGDIDHRSDLYALGIILYEMATGTMPFDAPSRYLLLEKHLRAAPPPLNGIAYGACLQPCYEKLLSKKPADRFDRAREAWLAVKQAFEASSCWAFQNSQEVDASKESDVLQNLLEQSSEWHPSLSAETLRNMPKQERVHSLQTVPVSLQTTPVPLSRLLPISEEPAEGRSSRTQIPQTLVVEVSRAASPEKPTEPLEEAQSRGIPQREESRAGQVEGASTRIDILAPVESPSWLASLQQQTKYQGMGGVSGEQKRKEVAQTSKASDVPKKDAVSVDALQQRKAQQHKQDLDTSNEMPYHSLESLGLFPTSNEPSEPTKHTKKT